MTTISGSRAPAPATARPPAVAFPWPHPPEPLHGSVPLPKGRNMDSRPAWEPPVFNYAGWIDEEYEKQRIASLEYYEGDVVKTTKLLDLHTECGILDEYHEWVNRNIYSILHRKDAERWEQCDFFVDLWEDLSRDLAEVVDEHHALGVVIGSQWEYKPLPGILISEEESYDDCLKPAPSRRREGILEYTVQETKKGQGYYEPHHPKTVQRSVPVYRRGIWVLKSLPLPADTKTPSPIATSVLRQQDKIVTDLEACPSVTKSKAKWVHFETTITLKLEEQTGQDKLLQTSSPALWLQ